MSPSVTLNLSFWPGALPASSNQQPRFGQTSVTMPSTRTVLPLYDAGSARIASTATVSVRVTPAPNLVPSSLDDGAATAAPVAAGALATEGCALDLVGPLSHAASSGIRRQSERVSVDSIGGGGCWRVRGLSTLKETCTCARGTAFASFEDHASTRSARPHHSRRRAADGDRDGRGRGWSG